MVSLARFVSRRCDRQDGIGARERVVGISYADRIDAAVSGLSVGQRECPVRRAGDFVAIEKPLVGDGRSWAKGRSTEGDAGAGRDRSALGSASKVSNSEYLK